MLETLKKATAVQKLRSIVKGWSGYIFESEEIEAMAKLRAVECAKCPNAVKGLHDKILDDRIDKVEGMVCNECKCPLSAKLRSEDEKCPLNKW